MMTGVLSRRLVGLARQTIGSPASLRHLCSASRESGGGSGRHRGKDVPNLKPLRDVGRAAGEDLDDAEEALFSPENTAGMSPIEIARMRVVYGFVKEHADVVENMLPPVDPVANPLIDQRSFELQTLPKLPDAALQQFRKDLPADDADVARALSTRAAWDPVGSNAEKGQQAASKTELASLVGARDEADTWAAVDERTMDPHYFLRMRRQSIQQAGVRSAGGATPPVTTMSGQQTAVGTRAPFRRCRLSDRRGRVSVDYREAGTLSEFLNVHGKIMHRRKTGLSAKAQRKVSRAVKTARQMALLHPEPRPGLTVKEMQEMEKALQLE